MAAALKTIDLLEESQAPREQLESNTRFFREHIARAGFTIKPGSHPIVPIMLGDAKLAQDMAAGLLDEGVYAIGFFFPVVPKNQARITGSDFSRPYQGRSGICPGKVHQSWKRTESDRLNSNVSQS